jgi:hypothetical protein
MDITVTKTKYKFLLCVLILMSTMDEMFIVELQNSEFVYFKVNGGILPDAMHFSLRHVGWCVMLSVIKNKASNIYAQPTGQEVLVLLYVCYCHLSER